MKEYTFIYKCHLCGKEFISGVTGSKEVAMREMSLVDIGKSTNFPTTISHQCDENNFGFAYISGVKCREVEKRTEIKYKDGKASFEEV